MLSTLLDYFTRYGYWVVFFGVMLENMGVPVPGETVLLAAGVFVAQRHFHMGTVIIVAAMGAMVGDNTSFLIGHKVGRAALERYGQYVWRKPKHMARFDSFFARHGDKTILFARFITGLRVFAALLAGAARMRWPTFAFYNAAGAILWSVAITLAGFFFGRSWNALELWIGRGGLIALVAAAAVFGTTWWLRRRRLISKREEGGTAW